MSISRHAILVAGMHRSGTSAMTRVLNLLGAEIGNKLLPARAENPSGYWEARDMVALNDECLQHFDLTWHDPAPLPEGWLDTPWMQAWHTRAVTMLKATYGDAPLIVAKDPRLSRLLPAWLRIMRELGIEAHVVIMLRHPDEVALSLGNRDDLPIPPATAYALWLSYLLEAEAASRDRSRVLVRFEDLLDDWHAVAARLANSFGLAWPARAESVAAAINDFLDPDLRHHSAQRMLASQRTALARRMASVYRELDQNSMDERCGRTWFDQLRLEWRGDMEMLGELQNIALKRHGSEHPALDPATQSGAGLWEPTELHLVTSRLYFRKHTDGYDESRVLEAEASGSDGLLRARFKLPAGVNPEFIRFDPAPRAGYYRVTALCINGTALSQSELLVTAAHQRLLDPADDELVRLYCHNHDPWIELDLRQVEIAKDRTWTVEWWFERDSLPDMLRRKLDALVREQETIQSHLCHAQQQLDELRRGEFDRASQVDTAAASINANIADTYAAAAFNTLLAAHAPTRTMRGIALSMRPGHQVRQIAQYPRKAARLWCNEGGDPQFVLTWKGDALIAPGWYCFAIDAYPVRGALVGPRLYVDYGDGFIELHSIPLAISPDCIRQRPLVRFIHPVKALRLDPCSIDARCDFMLSSPALQRVSSTGAWFRLGMAAMQRSRTRGASWGAIGHETLATLRKGSTIAVLDSLHDSHHAAVVNSSTIDYETWAETCDTLNDVERSAIRAKVARVANPPLISIVLPVYNTPQEWLRRCLDSVLNQIYPHWELCIADDASTNAKTRAVLVDYATRDDRIKIVWRDRNGHISAASNSALALATGDWVALLDHDDELAEHALYHVACAIIERSDLKLIYSDEDKLNANGKRVDPYFKPDWNPELFLSQNFICHLGVYATDLVRELGGFREGCEGSQDYDLALRVIERVKAEQIAHIPRVLYHWRAIVGSTALASNEKSYTKNTTIKALSDHLRRTAQAGVVEVTDQGYYRLRRELPTPVPKVSLIIPTRDHVDLLRISVGSILRVTDYPNFEIIVVDNQSSDPDTLDWFARIVADDSRVRVLPHDKPFNFSSINNGAAEVAQGEILGLVNNDIEATDASWLTEMVCHAARPEIGAVGAKLYYPNGTIQHAGIILGMGGVAGHPYCRMPHDYNGQMGRAHLTQSMSAVTAACLLVRKSVYFEVGGMNEELEVAFNDVDFCLRVREAGYRNVWTPYAELVHHESASRGYEDTPEKAARFSTEVLRMQAIWGDLLITDPNYNPNLSLRDEAFTLGRDRQISATR